MKRLVLMLAVVMLFAGVASAEMDYGMRMGLTIGNLDMEPDYADEESGVEKKMKVGVYLGAWGRFMLNEKMGILTGLNYAQKGDKYTEEDGGDTGKIIFFGNVLEIPVLFSYMLSENFEMYAGPVLGYMFEAGEMYKVKPDGENGMTYFEGAEMGDYVNRFQFSMAAGMKYHFSEKYFAELGYDFGFSNLVDAPDEAPDDLDIKTRTLYFGVGFSM